MPRARSGLAPHARVCTRAASRAGIGAAVVACLAVTAPRAGAQAAAASARAGPASWLGPSSAVSPGATTEPAGPSRYRYPPHTGPGDRAFWIAAAGALAGGILLDRTAGPAVRNYRTPFLTRIAPLGDVFGTANYTVPTVTAALIAAQVARNPGWEDATRHVMLSYVLADVTGALIKGGVGRQRPRYSGDPWLFEPFSFSDEWHSFPSGHVTHISAIAAAFAEEAHRPWITGLGAGAVMLTGWQRLYRDQHWASDVVGGMIVGTAASRVTAHWLRHRRPRPTGDPVQRGRDQRPNGPAGDAVNP